MNELLQGELIKQIVVYFQYKDSLMLRDYKDYFELKGQFERLRMENKLLRDFLQLTDRK